MNADFAAVVRRRRQQLDLTRGELAQVVGCSPDTIKKIESGARRPSKQLAELLARHLQIAGGDVAEFVTHARQGVAPAPPLGNLPTPLTGLVGREEETQIVVNAIVEDEARLVTLVGAPGVGKSRLALFVAQRLAAEFPDGVWYLPVGSLEAPHRLIPALAQRFGLPDGADATAWLLATLRSRRLLLVLDDFDAHLEASGALTDLLQACGQVFALLTAGAPLRVYGEVRITVPPLPTPDGWKTPSELAQVPAVQLYLARVKAHQARFRLSADNAAAVAEICTRLEGIPLALELAAGRGDAATPDRLLATLAATGRLDLAPDQVDYAPQRRTLRAVIAGSVTRLDPADQALFAALGVFQAPFDLDAALAVAGTNGETATQLRGRLDKLATRNLIQLLDDGGAPRYRLLDTLREAAAAMLGDGTATRRRHARHFAHLGSALDPARKVGYDAGWRAALHNTYPDWVAALAFAHQDDALEAGVALQLAVALGHSWYLEGDWEAGARRLGQILARPGGDGALRARVETELGILAIALGRYTEAEAAFTDALAQARAANDLYAQAWTLSQIVHMQTLYGQPDKARANNRERLQISRQLNDLRYHALTLQQMGIDAVEASDYDQAQPWLQECLAIWEDQDAPGGCGTIHSVLGMATLAQGDTGQALAHFIAAHEYFSLAGQAHGLAWTQRNLGLAYLALEDLDAARRALQDALARYEAMRSANAPIMIVEGAALLVAAHGDDEQAAQWMACAAAQRALVGLPLTENSRQIYARLMSSKFASLPLDPAPPVWTAALAQVHALLHAEAT